MLGVVKRLLSGIAIVMCCLLMVVPHVFAGTTGQIKGKITDKDTKEPVIGASVMIVGTKVGCQSDVDGNFQILRVEPGTYTLQVSAVNYSKMEISNVVVTVDLTKEVNVQLEPAAAQLNNVIKVTAKQDILDKFTTSNTSTITATDIKTRPVQTVDNLLKQVPGVQTNRSGQVYIRGGRAGEVQYIVDGVPIGDPLGGLGAAGANMSLTSGSIQEIQIIKDGFDPEYGNALSGIVKISSQTGSKDNTKISTQFLTDDLGTTKLNKYSVNYDHVQFSLSGPDPIFKNRILPALGLKFLEDKEFTYYFYAEVDKSNGDYPYDKYDSPTTRANWGSFSLLGIDIPNRLLNRYNWQFNVKFRPRQNLKFVASYKTSDYRYTSFGWAYRYNASYAPVNEDKWKSISLEVSQELAKNMNYEALVSYYEKRVSQKPGDPNNPGHGLNPDQFVFDSQWESYDDRNDNGRYDAPEPVINLYPDSASYGDNFSGPSYTAYEPRTDTISQTGQRLPTRFTFNSNGLRDSLEGEPYLDLNGNGVWDRGDFLHDKDGDGELDADLVSKINVHNPEPYVDGDSIIGEPFTDLNGNGKYDAGVDIFVKSTDDAVNQDLNHNGQHDGPENTSASQWEPGIPFIDRNGNSIFDAPNGKYDPGEPFTDVNGNGKYDYGGTESNAFYSPGSYSTDASWTERYTKTYRGEARLYRQMGAHELKLGTMISRDVFDYARIDRPYIEYVGKNDGGPYPDRGAFRDVFHYKPWNGTVYFNDKIEYGSMIASLGVRWDFFLQDTGPLVDVVKGDGSGWGTIYGDRQRISPRIGFSYPISDKAKVHFNYGHFYQLPDYQYLYARNTVNVSENTVVGNYNLDYMKTVQYSFGVKYAMNENYTLDLSGYFKDEFDKINQQYVEISENNWHNRYENSDYGRSRGFELTLEKRGGGYVNGQVSYTYAFAYGKASETVTQYLDPVRIQRSPLTESPLDNDVRHSLKTGIQVYIPTSVKPRLFGLPIPNGWSLSIESVIESGLPFTPDTKYPGIVAPTGESIETNSLRLPMTAVFDIRLEKSFQVVGIDYSVILWVKNLFNARNVTSVYPSGGSTSSTGRADTNQNIDRIVYGGTDFDLNPYKWDYGRQVRLGLEVNL